MRMVSGEYINIQPLKYFTVSKISLENSWHSLLQLNIHINDDLAISLIGMEQRGNLAMCRNAHSSPVYNSKRVETVLMQCEH